MGCHPKPIGTKASYQVRPPRRQIEEKGESAFSCPLWCDSGRLMGSVDFTPEVFRTGTLWLCQNSELENDHRNSGFSH